MKGSCDIWMRTKPEKLQAFHFNKVYKIIGIYTLQKNSRHITYCTLCVRNWWCDRKRCYDDIVVIGYCFMIY